VGLIHYNERTDQKGGPRHLPKKIKIHSTELIKPFIPFYSEEEK
jgi:hypothetical protein